MNLLARERGFSAIAYGENADDPAHLRPGSRAAAEFAVLAPLKEAGLTKAEVRALSRTYGLPTPMRRRSLVSPRAFLMALR